jgi:hypothetical protein
MAKLTGLKKQLERSMIFEPSEFELAKFDYLASSEFHDFQHK